MPLGMEVGLGRGDILLDGDPFPPEKRGHSMPQVLAHVFGQTAGWIKMPLGMGRPRPRPHCVTSGPSPHPEEGAQQPPNFHPVSNVAKRMDGSRCGYGGRPQPWPHCVRWGPAPLPRKGHSSPLFLAHVYCGQTVTHLTNC